MIQPGITARITVCTKSAPRVGSEPAIRAPIIEGGGRSTVGTFSPTQITSHRKSSGEAEQEGNTMPPPRARRVGARAQAECSSAGSPARAASQAASAQSQSMHAAAAMRQKKPR